MRSSPGTLYAIIFRSCHVRTWTTVKSDPNSQTVVQTVVFRYTDKHLVDIQRKWKGSRGNFVPSNSVIPRPKKFNFIKNILVLLKWNSTCLFVIQLRQKPQIDFCQQTKHRNTLFPTAEVKWRCVTYTIKSSELKRQKRIKCLHVSRTSIRMAYMVVPDNRRDKKENWIYTYLKKNIITN